MVTFTRSRPLLLCVYTLDRGGTHPPSYDAMLAARPRSPALETVIRRLVGHINARFKTGKIADLPENLRPSRKIKDAVFGTRQLAITGPVAWGWATMSVNSSLLHSVCTFQSLNKCSSVTSTTTKEQRKVLVAIVVQDEKIHLGARGGNNYNVLFDRGMIYCETRKSLRGVHHRCANHTDQSVHAML